jgi:serine/threonine protein kinase
MGFLSKKALRLLAFEGDARIPREVIEAIGWRLTRRSIEEEGCVQYVISEKNVMALMNHPFIIKLYATYKDQDFLYFLLDVCLGGELFTLLSTTTEKMF